MLHILLDTSIYLADRTRRRAHFQILTALFNSSTRSKVKLGAGEYIIKVSRPGFQDWERRIEAGSSKTLNALLEKLQ